MYEYQADLARVVDGDTVDLIVKLGFHIRAEERFRLAGIDTPERGQPGWAEATAALTVLLAGGIQRIETIKTDKYGRWLVMIWTPEGVNVNLQMIGDGHALPYNGGSR